jgi:hypothetical protein
MPCLPEKKKKGGIKVKVSTVVTRFPLSSNFVACKSCAEHAAVRAPPSPSLLLLLVVKGHGLLELLEAVAAAVHVEQRLVAAPQLEVPLGGGLGLGYAAVTGLSVRGDGGAEAVANDDEGGDGLDPVARGDEGGWSASCSWLRFCSFSVRLENPVLVAGRLGDSPSQSGHARRVWAAARVHVREVVGVHLGCCGEVSRRSEHGVRQYEASLGDAKCQTRYTCVWEQDAETTKCSLPSTERLVCRCGLYSGWFSKRVGWAECCRWWLMVNTCMNTH